MHYCGSDPGSSLSQLEFDDSFLPKLEALYRTPEVLRRRRLVRAALAAAPGERIIDVGCGPGFYVEELLDEVGPQGHVLGVDPSPSMLRAAGRRCAGRENASFLEADATTLPADDGRFDAALSVQVLEYVEDVGVALGELYRVLRPGGRLVLWDVDWSTLSLHSSDSALTDRVLEAWDDHLSDPALPRTFSSRLREAGFTGIEVAGHAFVTTEPAPDSWALSLITLVQEFVAGRRGISESEAAAWAAEQHTLREGGAFYLACIQVCASATRG